MRYSIEPKNRIYVKWYGFLSFAKNMSNKYSQKFLTLIKSLKQMQQKLLEREQFKKQQKQMVI